MVLVPAADSNAKSKRPCAPGGHAAKAEKPRGTHQTFPGPDDKHLRTSRRSLGPRRPGLLGGEFDYRSLQPVGNSTLVERTTRYVMLVHLPVDHTAESVRDGLIKTMCTLPAHLRGSLTWDQGVEMAKHKAFSIATDMDVYFCDPASPWQRGSNENTNGLLRQYFPKGTDLNAYGPEDLEQVAQELNDRPRKTLGWNTPAESLRDLLIAS